MTNIINRKFMVDAQVWKITDGIPIELKLDDNIYYLKNNYNPTVVFKPVQPKKHKRNIKISYLLKWIQQNNFNSFTLEEFFKKYPKQKHNNRLNSHIVSLIDKKIITQLGNNKFRVNRR